MKTLLLGLAMLSGCTPYWSRSAAFSDFEPVAIRVTYTDDLAPCAAASPVLGCAVRIKESLACYVYVKASQSRDMRRCVAGHEYRHCQGWDHEGGRPNYAVDCGDGSVR